VRFLAAASDAFLARAERSAGVMFFAAVLPPRWPLCGSVTEYTGSVETSLVFYSLISRKKKQVVQCVEYVERLQRLAYGGLDWTETFPSLV
jgi:hypothetical protein